MEQLPALVVQDLRIAFSDGHVALKGISFSIPEEKTLAIVGESGSGKSLTALALLGLLPKSAGWSGLIHINNAHIGPDTPAALWSEIRGRVASMVFQEPMSALNPVMNVGKQIAEALRASAGLSAPAAKRAAIEWLGKVKIDAPERSYHKYPHQLSGGQRQRVMIAMAMSAKPALMIADEPTTALDVTVQAEILNLLKTLQAETGTALLFITHDLALAAQLADEVLVLRSGEMKEYGTAQQVLGNPQHPYTKALIACRPGTTEKGMRLPVVADFMDYGVILQNYIPEQARQSAPLPTNIPQHLNTPTIPRSNTPTLLQVRHLRVWFPTETDWLGTPQHFLRAVEDVSFDLHRGEVLGLVGESGCGKSTISRAIMGLQQIESGQMLFEGHDLTHLDTAGWRRIRRDVQMIFQDPYASLNPRLTIGDAITEPMLVHGIVPKRELKGEAKRLMGLVGMPESALQRYPHQFSGGQRQRIGIARAIALRPKLIICDENVSALDVSVQAQILNLLKDLQAELKLSYLFISHDLNVVHYIADRVLVMHAGKIVERGDADDVLKRPKEEYTKNLVAAVL